jgi:hypothetical protein
MMIEPAWWERDHPGAVIGTATCPLNPAVMGV